MNVRVLLQLLGIISLVVGASMTLPLGVSVYYYFHAGERDFMAFVWSMLIALATGSLLVAFGKTGKKAEVLRREGLGVVGLGWILAAALGAAPFYLAGTVPSYIDAYFESMSGFTTTGSTVLDAIDTQPHGILLWRSLTQWLGGMGIVVLFVAIIPFLRASGKQLLYTEVPGPTAETLQPRIRDTAATLWKLYVAFTLALIGLLVVQGMPAFEAVCHSFTAMSTGGYSPRGASIGYYDSPGIEVTIIVFMVIAGTNFGLYYRTIRGDWKAIFRDAEWRFYILTLAVAIGILVADLWIHNRPLAEALRVASFQAVSITTTTGFGTEDFDHWPSLSRSLMVILFFVGGCAGSTAGGIKVVRILVIIKNALLATERAIRPQAVRVLRVGKTVVEHETRETILAFFTIVMGTMVLSTLALAACGLDPISALTAAATALNNIGPGLGTVGAAESFSQVPAPGKALLSFLMVVGRLEVFAILVLLSPRLWRST